MTTAGFSLEGGLTEIEIACVILGEREESADGVWEYPVWTGDEDGDPIRLVASYATWAKAAEHARQLANEYEVELVDA